MSSDGRKCPACYGLLETDGTCSCGYGVKKRDRGDKLAMPQVDLDCPWLVNGVRCGKRGSCSESTNGSGPWYCSDHFWYGVKGHPKPPGMQSWKALYDEPAQRMREPGED